MARYVNWKITDMEIAYIAIHVCAAMERKKNKEIAFHVISSVMRALLHPVS